MSPPAWLRYNCVIAGSGSAAFGEACVADLVIKQALKVRGLRNRNHNNNKPIQISYVGTPTYDSPAAREKQTIEFEKRGCKIVDINVTWPHLTRNVSELRNDIIASDVLLISGGNTLYSVRRWKEIGLDVVFREAAENGIILSGGSAGALVWFDGGHSDSADSTTFRPPLPTPLNPQDGGSDINATVVNTNTNTNVENQSEKPAPTRQEDIEDWKYLRVTALGFFPGLFCPHHDRTQSNGIPRYIDFDNMLKSHSAERGLCLDHWAVLTIEEGGTYSMFEVPQMTGSVVVDGGKEEYDSYRNGAAAPFIENAKFDTKSVNAIPGLWIKDVTTADGEVKQKCCAPVGKLEDILRFCPPELIKLETAAEDEVMKRNPIH